VLARAAGRDRARRGDHVVRLIAAAAVNGKFRPRLRKARENAAAEAEQRAETGRRSCGREDDQRKDRGDDGHHGKYEVRSTNSEV